MRIARDVRRDHVALVFADVGQRPDAVDIADRPEALPGAHVLVDLDAVRVGLDPGGFEADPLDAWSPAGGHEHAVAAKLGAILELEHVVLALAPGRARADAERELDAVAAKDLPERLAEGRRLAGQKVLGALDEGHLAAEATDGLGHLDADRPAAEDEQAPRDRLHAGHPAVGPDAAELAQPGDWRHDRVGTVREDDVLGGVADAVALDDARPGEPAGAAEQVDPVVGQPALLAGVGVVGDHEVAPGERGLDVDLRARPGLPRALHRLPRAQQRLRW